MNYSRPLCGILVSTTVVVVVMQRHIIQTQHRATAHSDRSFRQRHVSPQCERYAARHSGMGRTLQAALGRREFGEKKMLATVQLSLLNGQLLERVRVVFV